MEVEIKKPYLLICEGDSEFAYVQELNRFLNERGLPLVFVARNAGGGGFKNLRQVCRTLKTRKNGRMFIMADKDIYHRDDNGNGTAYEKEMNHMPPFLFQYWNFEDFLLMHYPEELLVLWRETAARCGHTVDPLHSKDFLPVFTAFCNANSVALGFMFPYEKGDMPFALTQERMECLFANNQSGRLPYSELAKLLSELIGSPSTLTM